MADIRLDQSRNNFPILDSRLEQAPRRSGSATILMCRNGAELVPAYTRFRDELLRLPLDHHQACVHETCDRRTLNIIPPL